MFQQAWSIEVVVSRTIGELATHGRARERAIVYVLPTHLEWREMPVVTTRNAGAVGISFLVATRAVQTRHTFAFGSTAYNVRDVTMPIVALLWIVGGSVTVDAAR
jgi:hypothetical protein